MKTAMGWHNEIMWCRPKAGTQIHRMKLRAQKSVFAFRVSDFCQTAKATPWERVAFVPNGAWTTADARGLR